MHSIWESGHKKAMRAAASMEVSESRRERGGGGCDASRLTREGVQRRTTNEKPRKGGGGDQKEPGRHACVCWLAVDVKVLEVEEEREGEDGDEKRIDRSEIGSVLE